MSAHEIKILRAARAYLNLKQSEIAEISGVSIQTISNLESEKTDGSERTLRRMRQIYEEKGIVFTAHGMEYQPYKIAILENFMDVLTDAEMSLKKGDEILIHCADERRNTSVVTEKLKDLRKKGIHIRMTCEEGNLFITGPKKEYRWISSELFASSQIEVTYKDKYVFHFQDGGSNIFIVTKNKGKAGIARRQFEYHWKRGKTWENVQTM